MIDHTPPDLLRGSLSPRGDYDRDGTRGNFETTDPNTFVGRVSELAELRAALDDAAAGRGRLFLISGNPESARLASPTSSL